MGTLLKLLWLCLLLSRNVSLGLSQSGYAAEIHRIENGAWHNHK
jgi:hypothetical protein